MLSPQCLSYERPLFPSNGCPRPLLQEHDPCCYIHVYTRKVLAHGRHAAPYSKLPVVFVAVTRLASSVSKPPMVVSGNRSIPAFIDRIMPGAT